MTTQNQPQEVQQNPKYPSDEEQSWLLVGCGFTTTHSYKDKEIMRCFSGDEFTQLVRKACDWQSHQCREQVARWMLSRGFATGHGNTIEDLLTELVGEVRSRDALGRVGETK